MVWVRFLTATAIGTVAAKMTDTRRSTKSFAKGKAVSESLRPSIERYSIDTFCPST
jgi:hypothetical protein